MRHFKYLLFLVLIAFGAFLVVFGERDDSPGAQLLGVVLALSGLISIVRAVRSR